MNLQEKHRKAMAEQRRKEEEQKAKLEALRRKAEEEARKKREARPRFQKMCRVCSLSAIVFK